MFVRSVSVSVALLLAACGGAAEHKPAATPAPTTTTTAAPNAAAAKSDLRVYTLHDFQIHGAQTKGRYFRKTATGWESADCTESLNPDNAKQNTGPACGAWTPVPADKLQAVTRAAAAGEEIDCAKQKPLCDDLGLKAETP